MEKNLTVFENEEFGKVRTIEIDGEVWFVGKDVASALGYKDTDKAIRNHVDNEDKKTYPAEMAGQVRHITIINESGLYSLILGSKLKSAKRFKHWVTSEILPSIRKNGFYATENFSTDTDSDQLLDFTSEILITIANGLKKSTEKKKDLRGKIPIADQQILLMFDSMQKRIELQQKKIEMQQKQMEELQSEIQKLKEDYQILLPF